MTEILNGNKFGTIDLEDIKQFESHNGVTLPEDYKSFLLKYNGGKPKHALEPTVKSDIQWIYGMVAEPYYASLFQHLDMFQGRLPSWYFPIANDSGGNLYLMSLYEENRGLIAFWDHENEAEEGQADQYFENLTVVASSFTDFLNQLVDYTN